MDIRSLATLIEPEHTVLLMGAGAAVQSGAPTGAALAEFLASRLKPSPDGDELPEIAGIFEDRLGRPALVKAVRDRLVNLEPTGGLLAVPAFDWRAIYSTNFDTLVEESYRRAHRRLQVVRSNYDFSRQTAADAMLFKIHGCITQDLADGHHSRMVLTEDDYEEVETYRQSLFNSLRQHMTTADTVIVGQSLGDRHLRDLAKEVASLRTQGVQGRVYLLAFDYNDDRARLYSRRGIEVAPGSLEDLLHALNVEGRSRPPVAHTTETTNAGHLPPPLAPLTVDVAHAASLPPNPVALFNGSPATYGDINSNMTITRAVERRLLEMQSGVRGFFTVIAGAAGVGKTSLARALLLKRSKEGFACWEHLNHFPLNVDEWMAVEASLRAVGRQGVLLIDDCAQHLAAVNRLTDALGKLDRPFLRLVVTANAAQWKTRTKSPYFFSRGSIERLSVLTTGDIHELVNLVDRQPDIRTLVENDFLHLGHRDRVRRLQDRCSADMFVCLKNIFRNENLDNILLQEFADLDVAVREVYRHVAALQAMGGRVHRQLIVRLLGIDVLELQSLLTQMEDVIAEYDIDHRQGLYGWSARHDVIANIIATYKFADQEELLRLLERLIDGLNPTIHIERETARAIASNEMGIARLTSLDQQADLLQRLIQAVPGERIPRRRLIRLYLRENQLADAERVISAATKDLGSDDIITTYRSVLALRRAEVTSGLLDEDRHAMLLEAERLAKQCVGARPFDRHNYVALADVGLAMARRFSDLRVLDEAIDAMVEMESEIGDPEFVRDRTRLESQRRQLDADVLRDEEEGEDPILEDSEA
jgi:hypothetical protein